jgi:hypothetical protein
MICIICTYDVWLWSITYLSCVCCSVSLQNYVEYGVFVCFIRDGRYRCAVIYEDTFLSF